MAFTKDLWKQIGGFPEDVLVGEDTLYDLEAKRRTVPAFVTNAKARYQPQYTFGSACYYLARYATSDGMARVRWARLFRNAARCLLEITALVVLRWSFVPLLCVLALELWYAYHRDWRFIGRFGLKAIVARLAFSLAVPWVVAINHFRGLFKQSQLTNPQNTRNTGTSA